MVALAGAAIGGGASTGLMLASTAVSAMGKIQAGQAKAAEYDAQASQAELKGRSEAIAYKQMGADVLRNLNENLAAIIARAGAGGVDPTSGSARTTALYAQAEGIRELNITRDNALLAEGQAATQANQYRLAGQNAKRAAMWNALGTVSTGIQRVGSL
jgi:hypothetical protein